MNIFISGGAKNGKSMYAQKTVKEMAEEKNLPLYYIATMIPHDNEDLARIERHRRERAGWGFQTIELGTSLGNLIHEINNMTCEEKGDPNPGSDVIDGVRSEMAGRDRYPAGVFLLDSVTALLSNEMFIEDGRVDHDAPVRVAEECIAFAKATKNTVFVSDYIYGDGDKYDKLTEEYRRGLAYIDKQLARVCDRVVEVSAARIEDWK